jgi:hypothetical protein
VIFDKIGQFREGKMVVRLFFFFGFYKSRCAENAKKRLL